MKIGRRTWLRWWKNPGEDYWVWHVTLTHNKKKSAVHN